MCKDRPAFGEKLKQLGELGAIEFRPEPLDDGIERLLKAIWAARSCPICGEDSLHALNDSERIWCGYCHWKTTYTRETPFYDSELALDEFLIVFILYADTLLSISQIAFPLSPSYKTLYDRLKETEAAFVRVFPTVWDRISQTVGGPTQVDATQQACSGFKGQDPPRGGLERGGSPEGERTRWTGTRG